MRLFIENFKHVVRAYKKVILKIYFHFILWILSKNTNFYLLHIKSLKLNYTTVYLSK